MYTVAVKDEDGKGKYVRHEVHRDVYVYIRQLEWSVCDKAVAHRLKLNYPSRFPAFEGAKDGD